jgi:hypothetical protein
MSESQPTAGKHEHPWHAFVVPTARGLEGFAWRVAWFALFVKILFFN